MDLAEAVERLRGIADHPQMSLVESEALKVVLGEVTRATTLVACERCKRGVRWRYAVKGICPDCAAAEIDRLTAERDAASKALETLRSAVLDHDDHATNGALADADRTIAILNGEAAEAFWAGKETASMSRDIEHGSAPIRRAIATSRKISAMLQGTMGLEGQALDRAALKAMTRQTARELLDRDRAASKPPRKVRFSFDERSFDPIEKLVAQGRISGDFDEVEVVNPATGEGRVLLIPRLKPRETAT